jgi:catechol 2,3-dioxygenase
MDQPKLPTGTRISSADLQVSSLERALGFYRDRLGFRPIEVISGEAHLSATGQPPYLLRLVELAGARRKPAFSTGLFHLAIRLPGRTALANLLLHMIDTRTQIQGASDHLVSEAIYLSDPDGNGLELYEDRPQEQWPRSGDQIAMTTAPLDFDDLINQADQNSARWQGIDPGTNIGHIHLQVADLAKTEVFYHSQLGFEVTQRTYPGALFFAAGGYHHHIGTNVWNSRGAPPPPPEAAGLFSYRIEIPEAESQERIIHKLDTSRTEYQVRRNSNDRISFWVRDPSEILIELVFG